MQGNYCAYHPFVAKRLKGDWGAKHIDEIKGPLPRVGWMLINEKGYYILHNVVIPATFAFGDNTLCNFNTPNIMCPEDHCI